MIFRKKWLSLKAYIRYYATVVQVNRKPIHFYWIVVLVRVFSVPLDRDSDHSASPLSSFSNLFQWYILYPIFNCPIGSDVLHHCIRLSCKGWYSQIVWIIRNQQTCQFEKSSDTMTLCQLFNWRKSSFHAMDTSPCSFCFRNNLGAANFALSCSASISNNLVFFSNLNFGNFPQKIFFKLSIFFT